MCKHNGQDGRDLLLRMTQKTGNLRPHSPPPVFSFHVATTPPQTKNLLSIRDESHSLWKRKNSLPSLRMMPSHDRRVRREEVQSADETGERRKEEKRQENQMRKERKRYSFHGL